MEPAPPFDAPSDSSATEVDELGRLRGENDKLRRWAREVQGALKQARHRSETGAPAPPATARRPPPATTASPSASIEGFELGVAAARREFEALLAERDALRDDIEAQASEIVALKAQLRQVRRAAQRPEAEQGARPRTQERPSQLVGSLRTLKREVDLPT